MLPANTTDRIPYLDLERSIREAPVTWIPALLRAVVTAAVKGKVFEPGKLTAFVQRTASQVPK